jgi:hypothetical protein
MSERGRGSKPEDDDLGGDEAVEHPESAESSMPPAAAPPIAPYDPYRSSGAGARVPRRNVAAEDYESVRRSRDANRSPFLPDDDPLNADAWQLELGEIEEVDQDREEPRSEAERVAAPAPRRPRRQPPSSRSRPERASAAKQEPRRSRTPTIGRERPAVSLTVPRAVAGASLVSDQTMLALLGINLVSVLIMALLLGVRLGGLPSTVVLRLDAAGNPALWGSPSVLWRLPLMSLFITIMFLVVAWFVHPVDRFAARFALAAALVVQLIAWVAIILHLR